MEPRIQYAKTSDGVSIAFWRPLRQAGGGGIVRPLPLTEGDWITGQQFNPNGGMYM